MTVDRYFTIEVKRISQRLFSLSFFFHFDILQYLRWRSEIVYARYRFYFSQYLICAIIYWNQVHFQNVQHQQQHNNNKKKKYVKYKQAHWIPMRNIKRKYTTILRYILLHSMLLLLLFMQKVFSGCNFCSIFFIFFFISLNSSHK